MAQADLVFYSGTHAVAVIDFTAAGDAAAVVTINGVAYTEANAEDLDGGVWTNGATAADSATSLAAAINGDTRNTAPPVRAVVSAEGNSVVVVAERPGDEYNYALTTTSATIITVEDMHGGEDSGSKRMAVVRRVVTAQDIKANEIDIPVEFPVTDFILNVSTTAGAPKVVDSVTTAATAPHRVRMVFSGVTDPIAGDVVSVVAFE